MCDLPPSMPGASAGCSIRAECAACRYCLISSLLLPLRDVTGDSDHKRCVSQATLGCVSQAQCITSAVDHSAGPRRSSMRGAAGSSCAARRARDAGGCYAGWRRRSIRAEGCRAPRGLMPLGGARGGRVMARCAGSARRRCWPQSAEALAGARIARGCAAARTGGHNSERALVEGRCKEAAA